MCGIVGVVVKDSSNLKEIKSNVIKLTKEASIRGLHSFGYAYFDEEGKVCCSKFHSIDEMIDSIVDVKERMIFHNRYSTSGDWKDHNNNQPIQSGNSAIVFNGVISMKTKAEMEQEYGVEMKTENDGELALLLRSRMNKLVSGKSFAALILENGKITVYRNKNRPCYSYEDSSAIYFASTSDIFRRAIGVVATEVKPNTECSY